MARNKLIDKILKSSGNKYGDVLANAEYMKTGLNIPTMFPAMNIAFSGDLDGGFETSGITQLVGESKSFKTLFLLVMMKSYLDSDPEATAIIFDSERGASRAYFASLGIDDTRVAFLPIVSVEDLKIQAAAILKDLERGEKVFIAVDSIGLLPSDKEVKDAEDGKDTADMTRARAMNSFFRIVTTRLSLLDLPMAVVNHSYDEMTGGKYAKKIVKGGKVGYLAADTIWMISRSQEKNSQDDLVGYNFNITIEKSRAVIEKSRIPITVTFEKGIRKYSGILDIAVEGGFVIKPKVGWYQLKDEPTAPQKRANDTEEMMERLCKTQDFKDYVKKKYQLAANNLIQNVSSTPEFIEDLED